MIKLNKSKGVYFYFLFFIHVSAEAVCENFAEHLHFKHTFYGLFFQFQAIENHLKGDIHQIAIIKRDFYILIIWES